MKYHIDITIAGIPIRGTITTDEEVVMKVKQEPLSKSNGVTEEARFNSLGQRLTSPGQIYTLVNKLGMETEKAEQMSAQEAFLAIQEFYAKQEKEKTEGNEYKNAAGQTLPWEEPVKRKRGRPRKYPV